MRERAKTFHGRVPPLRVFVNGLVRRRSELDYIVKNISLLHVYFSIKELLDIFVSFFDGTVKDVCMQNLFSFL
jgi:hypothetical protein